MSHFCEKCGKTLDDKEFYTSKRVDQFPPDGKLHVCKKCLTMHVDNWDPDTFLDILKDVDVPYIKEEWDKMINTYLEKHDPKKMTGMSIIGKYLAKMKLKQWNKYSWADTERLEEESRNRKITQMQAQGMSGDDIEAQLSIDRTPKKPDLVPKPDSANMDELFPPEDDELNEQLTEENKQYLRLKWGRGYRAEEWIKMESLYNDMMNSFDIYTAGHKDTLKMICKASLKANQCLDCGDIEGFQKMSKAYDTLMKSGKFTAAQNKEEQGDAVDSVGELVAMCERDGFIPKYYIDSPKDKVDRVIQDMQEYTHDLVTEELGLGNLIENSLKALERERESIKEASLLTEEDKQKQEEDSLFNYNNTILKDKEIIEAFIEDDSQEEEKESEEK